MDDATGRSEDVLAKLHKLVCLSASLPASLPACMAASLSVFARVFCYTPRACMPRCSEGENATPG